MTLIIKPAIITLLKTYKTLTVEKIVFMTGFDPDSVRRVLREDPVFYLTENTYHNRSWGYDPNREPPKVSPEKDAEYKANSIARERKRLKDSYIKGERIPWVFPDLGGI